MEAGTFVTGKFFAIRKASPSQLKIHGSAQLLEMPGSSEKNFLDPVFGPAEEGFTVYGSLATAAGIFPPIRSKSQRGDFSLRITVFWACPYFISED